MNCREAQYLLSPYFDGLLCAEESEAFAGHIGGCATCARELAVQEKLSVILRDAGSEDIQAPPELLGLVMTKVRTERRGILYRMPIASWRRAVAAAAAVLLLAGGSMGITAGLKSAQSGKMIGYGTVLPGAGPVNGNGDSVPDDGPAEGTSGQNDPHQFTVENNIPSDTKTGTGHEGAENGGMNAGNTGGGSGDGKDGTARPFGPGATALLSNEMKINSTVLKVDVEDLAGAWTKALELATGAGTTAHPFPEQSNGNNILFVRLTATSEQAPKLIADLVGLGTLTERQDESRDITYLYNETLVQYYDLLYRINIERDPVAKQQLEAQTSSYKQQLDIWAAEANKQIINLWLQSKQQQADVKKRGF